MKELPAALLMSLRHMSPDDAEHVFNQHGLEEADRERYRLLVGKKTLNTALVELTAEIESIDVPPLNPVPAYRVLVQDRHRNHWMATAWVLGASYRMLGKLHGITHQTVVQATSKQLSDKDRAGRLGFMLEPERISEYHKAYYEHRLVLANMTPLNAAIWLKTRVQHDALDADPRYEG